MFLARDLQVLTHKPPNYTPYASNWFFSPLFIVYYYARWPKFILEEKTYDLMLSQKGFF